jgi:hypothetical protein
MCGYALTLRDDRGTTLAGRYLVSADVDDMIID